MNLYAFADEADPAIEGQIRAMKRNGLLGLEIRNVNGKNVSKLTPDEAREVRCALDEAGLVTWSVGSPIGKIKIREDSFPEDVEKLKRTLEIASILGTDKIRIFSFYLPKAEDHFLFREEVIERMGIYAETAEGSGIRLYHENEKGIYGDRACRCKEILDAVPSLGGIFDPANYVQCGEDTLAAWDLLKRRTDYMHIKDAVSDGTVVPPGEGEGHVKEIASDFLQRGGKDFTIEPHLFSFSSLKELERSGNGPSSVKKQRYANADEAFDTAVAAFRKLMEE